MSQGFAALGLIVLWLLLGGLVILAGVAGTSPTLAVIPGIVLIPLSGFAALTALDLLAHAEDPPFHWPIVVSASVPPAGGGVLPMGDRSARASRDPRLAGWRLRLGHALAVSLAVWPMAHTRTAVLGQRQAVRDRWDAGFARMPKDASLWDWMNLLDTATGNQQGQVIERIRWLDRRQTDIETMLERGDFPLRYLSRIDLMPSQKICDTARALLRRNVEPLVLGPCESKPCVAIRSDAEGAVAGMEWLTGYDCSCDTESLAWKTMANAYSDTEYDVHRPRDLCDPKALGRTLREHPEHFSMLSPTSHLKAWLHFADDKSLHDRALAGARTLDHRTEDALEILGGSEYKGGIC